MKRRGFTLLEMLVATTVMGIAVVGLLASLSASLRNAARLTDFDRAALLGRRQMDELLLDSQLPPFALLDGRFDPALSGGVEAGWQARLTPFEAPPNAVPGMPVLERLELEIWWMSGEQRRTLKLETYRRGVLRPNEGVPP